MRLGAGIYTSIGSPSDSTCYDDQLYSWPRWSARTITPYSHVAYPLVAPPISLKSSDLFNGINTLSLKSKNSYMSNACQLLYHLKHVTTFPIIWSNIVNQLSSIVIVNFHRIILSTFYLTQIQIPLDILLLVYEYNDLFTDYKVRETKEELIILTNIDIVWQIIFDVYKTKHLIGIEWNSQSFYFQRSATFKMKYLIKIDHQNDNSCRCNWNTILCCLCCCSWIN